VKPLTLELENFRTFVGYHRVDFEDGLVGILGELRDGADSISSNGAGKSTLLEGIDVGLFGRRSLAGFLTRGGDVDTMTLTLTFDHAGETYRVRRSFSARTKAGKTTVDFERAASEVLGEDDAEPWPIWEPLTCSSTKETDQLIVETVGLSRDTYRNSSYLRQGDGSYADPARDPKQRKDLLVEAALGRDPVWPRLQEAARAARRSAETGLERLAGETRAARELADTKPDVVLDCSEARYAEEAATTALATAEAELQAVSERYLAAKDGAARRATCEAELEHAKSMLRALIDRGQAADAAARQIVEAMTRLEELGTAPDTARLEQRIAELQTAVEAHRSASQLHEYEARNATLATSQRDDTLRRASELATKAENLREQAGLLEDSSLEESCDRCGQHLGVEARARAVASIRDDADKLELEAKQNRDHAATITIPTVPPKPEGEAPTQELQTVVGQLRAAQTAAAERATLAERVTQLETAASSGPSPDDLTAAHNTVTAKQAELDDIEPVNLPAIESAGLRARALVDAHRGALDTTKTTRARLDERLAQITKAEAQIAESEKNSESLQASIDVETVIERACGRDGIPALLLENVVIPSLEVEADSILRQLGTPYRVELRTQAALKSGDGLRDTLDVVILDETGEAPYDDFSGGEQTRIGLALQIALAVYLALSGRGSRLLCLDEPSYLDSAGMTALLRVLEGLVARDVFSGVLLVSHVAELRDSLDNVIVVVKDGGRSRIDGNSTGSPQTATDVEVAA